ncbi:early endosome antigen 1-like [Anopheles maculipalpis]|uniref:early endosome antigen 1-like n=1 Tax=Anopheles maculipalpis TaxID=1496333 RepID=UPI002158F364|nr:early endosome antigen 1-like [Anopheles maculipalpis]
MAENQSAEHKEAYWRRVVLKWVKCAELTTSHDSFDLDTCYTNFRCKIEAYYELIENTVAEFLRVQFPHFELELSNENEVPKCDAVYVFSLMLYFSCIRYPIPYFQNVGQEFDVEYQRSMTAFLNSFVSKDGNQIIINRSFLDKAFQSAKPVASVLSEESSNRRVLSQQMITSTPSGKLEMRKPSPTTPKSVALEWKLKNLNALLETAQAENSSQERQIERLLQNMKKLQEEKKMYQSKINILQLKETCACGNNLTNLPNESNRVTEQLQKQLESKNQDIEMLQEELSKLKESANAEIERYTSMKKQYAVLEEDNQRMKIAVEDLKEDISMKEACNQNLFEIVKDLRRFINENQIKGAGLMESLESSFEFLDQSFKNVASDDSHCYDSENLASTVVEIKLKEKEHELEAMTRKSQELEDKLKAHLEKQNHLQAEYNEKDAKLRQTLAKSEKEKSQLTVDLEEDKAFIEDLNNQLESQKKAHLEKYECLQAEMKQETAGLVESLAAAEKEKSTLVEDLERGKDKLQDLNRQLQERERLVAELNENTVQLRQAWEKAEKEKSQLTVDLEEGKTFIEDLNNQLESQKKAHLEKYECLQAEMKQETAGLLESLAAAEKEKSTLVENLEREKDKMQDLNQQLQERERLVAELNENTVQLRQAWEKAEKEKSQLTVDLEEGKTFIEDLNNQLESQKKAHLEKYECLQAEMKQETAGLLESLAAAEKEKSTLVENLEREKDKLQDLNRQLQERERLVSELNENTVQLRQAWEKSEKEKSQLTVDLEEGKAFIEDLNNQLESQKKAHLEKYECLQAEMKQETAGLVESLAAAEKEKSTLVEDLERGKDKLQDLNRQLQERERLVAELNENTVQLRQALEKAEKEKSQLTVDLEEGKTFIENLNNQLESQKKAHLEKYECLQAEMKQETAGLLESLAAAEKEKSTLVENLEREKDKLQDLNRQLQERERLVSELNENTVQLRQAWEKSEKEKSQLTVDLEEDKAFIEDLNNQLESQKKAHLEKYECLQAEMKQETAGLVESLAAAEKEKSTLVEDLERGKDKLQDLNRQLQERERLVAELNENTVQLRQALEKAEKEKSQLTVDLEEGKTFIEDLNNQLELQKKAHLEKYECLQAEMKQETTGLVESLAITKKEKSQLAAELEMAKAKMQDLNRQLQEHERLQAEMCQKTAELRQALADAEKEKSQTASELRKALAEPEQNNSQLTEDLEKANAKMEDLNRQLQEHERLVDELNTNTSQLQQALSNAEEEKSSLTEDIKNGKSSSSSSTCQRDEMAKQILTLQQTLDQEQEKSEEISCQHMQAKRQADDLGVQCTKLMQQLSADRSEMANLQQQLATKDAKLMEMSVLHEETVKKYEKAYQDGEIVAAKLYTTRLALKEKEELWAKERASMANAMEEKLRDARIEHDSKMAKMKDRMVELHKEVKTKLESENQGLLLTVEGYRRKVENLEIRCAKLQQQLAEMNERNLEVRKENQLLHIRIKSLDEFGNDRKSVLLPTQANLRNNFKMEDEEGELFNNMYLADLKSGRCVSPGGPSTTKSGLNRYSELSQRNSMVMPHLRTNYVALEPDCEPPQDDTRDNMSTTFDDSSTGLISRRKVSGITSYKRPGPPTPSKRAGRLSLSGALSGNLVGEVQYKEVLRDANANDAVGGGTAAAVVGPGGESAARTARTKTPGKFKQMISSSSLLNNFQRDENTSPRRRLSWFNKGKKF